ncbi:hypothetical protein FYZ48_23085 [Gimesia chilikensis]|uniref:PH domain-containing protein n=1 Tax=Gimesia chilikensis TaxID=2605989 RepID=UPI0011EC7B2F|nr:PH domain-containing protein [Gimesia chilikensis]KAA0133736.1 hypothetical protein FYZ48_23085 [Gimesia chilikensis]
MADFFTNIMGQVEGPFTGTQIRDLAKTGRLFPDSFVRKGVDGNWFTADRIKGLTFGAAKPQPPPPPSLPVPSPTLAAQPASNVILENYDKYAEFTKNHDWKALCELNNVSLDSFGTKKELQALPDYLEPNEVVFALTSGMMPQSENSNSFDFGLNTWLVVLTSDRFLFLDAAILTSSVNTQSIRHDRVQAVSASQGWVLGKIMVDLGSRVLTIDNCQKATVKVIADLANKWLKEMSDKRNTNVTRLQAEPEESPLDKLEKLAKLHSMGVLSDEEFRTAKEKILSSL